MRPPQRPLCHTHYRFPCLNHQLAPSALVFGVKPQANDANDEPEKRKTLGRRTQVLYQLSFACIGRFPVSPDGECASEPVMDLGESTCRVNSPSTGYPMRNDTLTDMSMNSTHFHSGTSSNRFLVETRYPEGPSEVYPSSFARLSR